ncbi:MAG: glycoside hydrolase family 32 protein [Firmicutes bacterium]|nr:glycoside hydrolase family 32 protein [Bacillota bacterium]
MITKNNSSHESLLYKADNSVSKAISGVVDTYRLHYHLMPQAYWMNDPNGLVYYNGYYHVFYQHHPYSPHWGPMHWGHARTKDFINWEHLPIALAPSEEYDADGCFSGSAVVEDGVLHLFYTGYRVIDGQAVQVQCRATSTDGIHFVKDPHNPLVKTYPPDGSADFRDPKVWRHDGLWFMALGSGKDGKGKVLLYKSRDLSHWHYVGVAAESDGTQGTIWECPDIFPLGGKYVLVVSPIGAEPRRVIYFVGEMDYESGKFRAEYVKELDYGPDFYAPQTFFGAERRILLAWMDSWEANIVSKKDNWAGALTLPRELTLDSNGHLRIHPLPELKQLRKERVSATNVLLENNQKLFPLCDLQKVGLEVILNANLASTTASRFGIVFADPQNSQQITVGFKRNCGKLYLDTNIAGLGKKGIFWTELLPQQEKLEIRIFLDRSSIEVFADNGAASITSRFYLSSQKLVPELFAIDGKLITSIELWSLAK